VLIAIIASFFALSHPLASGEAQPCHVAPDGWCGVARAPLSYVHPERGGEVELGYEVLPARKAGSPTLIVVNGGPGGKHDGFHEIQAFERLRDRYNVVFYDQRGTGGSPMDDADVGDCEKVSTDANAEDLERIRRAVAGNRPVSVYAHSYGGWIALRHAERYPDRVSKLVLHSSGLTAAPFIRQETSEAVGPSDGPGSDFVIWSEYLERAPKTFRARLIAAEDEIERRVRTKGVPLDHSDGREWIDQLSTWRTILQSLLSTPDASDTSYVVALLEGVAGENADSLADLADLVDSIFDQINFDVNHTIVCSDFRDSGDPFHLDPRASLRPDPSECGALPRCAPLDLGQWITHVRAKTLVLGGANDSLTPLDEQQALAERIPGAKLVVFAHSGHDAMDEEPRKFERVLRSFL
jgi:pimeloyl-ACP methyl ester carboxylesterase